MTTATADHGYNYDRFRYSHYAGKIERDVDAGDEAVDATLHTLDGGSVELSELWSERPVVLEFGSVTCPIFVKKISEMDALARKYDEVDFYVVYVREAHPGENYTAHESLDEKIENARDLRELDDVERTVLVDDVEGTMHEKYGAFPNSVYVIGNDGVVAYRADWVYPEKLDERIEELLENGGAGANVTPESVEENYHSFDATLLPFLYTVTKRAGSPSLKDLVTAFPGMLRYRIARKMPNGNR